jgi:hypothetical protein
VLSTGTIQHLPTAVIGYQKATNFFPVLFVISLNFPLHMTTTTTALIDFLLAASIVVTLTKEKLHFNFTLKIFSRVSCLIKR